MFYGVYYIQAARNDFNNQVQMLLYISYLLRLS